MICTFFGHSDTSEKVIPLLEKQIVDLIENHNVSTFYVGNHGKFDSMIVPVLKKVKTEYPHIEFYIVLAYLPVKKKEFETVDHSITVYPSGLENVPYKFAICKRNEWMIEKADHVITYIDRSYGGAYLYSEKAKRKGKNVINLCEFSIE